MSQRFGMADGRCHTIHGASSLVNNMIMNQNGIMYEDNYSYRKMLQQDGEKVLKQLQEVQADRCTQCHKPVGRVPPNSY